MSYLHDPKIIFTGDFMSDVSTVNNDVRHYDNADFQKRFQEPQKGKVMNGWWNPEGGANFTFINCAVKKGFLPNGNISTADQDLVIGKEVSGSVDKPPGKMVDLDPQMQMTSQLWALSIRISDADGELLLEGDMDPTGFRDLGTRQFPKDSTRTSTQEYARNGQPAGGSWTTVLRNLKWGKNASKSPLLKTLKATTQEGKLSLNLNAYGYYYAHLDGRFSTGKIIGTIGPWLKGEPDLFAPARRLFGTVGSYFPYANYIYDEKSQFINVDLGNSIPINDPFGHIDNRFRHLNFAVSTQSDVNIPLGGSVSPGISRADFVDIGSLKIDNRRSWLDETGGIVSFSVPKMAQTLLKDHQLILYVAEGKQNIVYAREASGGLMLRADQNVFRMDPPKASATTNFYAYQWGKPLPNATVQVNLMGPMANMGGGSKSDPRPPQAKIPLINVPADKMTIVKPATMVTDKNGMTTCTLNGSDPDNYRKYIDGQIYLFSYGIKGVTNLDQYSMDWLFVHLRNAYPVPPKPTWDDVKDVWIQFGNLYPIMSKYIVDMGVREEVLKRRDILLFAFTRDINDPMYMPVTRDMSQGMQDTLIKWLKNPVEAKPTKKKAKKKVAAKSKKKAVAEKFNVEDLDPLNEFLIKATTDKGGQS